MTNQDGRQSEALHEESRVADSRASIPVEAARQVHEEAAPSQVVRPWEEAKPHFREMVAAMTTDDIDGFITNAVKWPKEEANEDNKRLPNVMSKALNPDGKKILPIDHETLLLILKDYDVLLEAQGRAVGDSCGVALEAYFDDARYEKVSVGESLPERGMVDTGRYNRNSTIEMWGWTVRTRFTTSDFPEAEIEFEMLDSIRSDRRSAVIDFIKGL